MTSPALPVESLLPSLENALANYDVLLSAPPGAGKSTAIPLALLAAGKKKLIMLQPRRVVVKQLASFLADRLNEAVGQTVGYRIKGEQRVSEDTRLEIITEGILTRRIQQDPELKDVDVIIFDEFHERNLHSDFGLALAIEIRQALRDDLRLLVMSATLNVSPLCALLPDAKVLNSEGRQYPVAVTYLGSCQQQDLIAVIGAHCQRIVQQEAGDILVFLPTVKHIQQLQQILIDLLDNNIAVLPLHGNLPLSKQQQAIRPSTTNTRKVILATNIAETSLTIEGIQVVIDSGRELVAEFQPKSQMTALSLQMISQASAEQRKGRAGRLGPGKCFRLWAKESHARLRQFSQPDILTKDISGVVLHAAAWGTKVNNLALIDFPTAIQQQYAEQSLKQLGAFSEHADITALGRQAVLMPVPPRAGCMLLKVRSIAVETGDDNWINAGALVAAISEESAKFNHWEVQTCLNQLQGAVKKRVVAQARRFARLLGYATADTMLHQASAEQLAVAVALLNPDWITRCHTEHRAKLAMGIGAELGDDVYCSDEWLAVLSGQRRETAFFVRIAQPISLSLLKTHFAEMFFEKTVLYFDSSSDTLRAESQQRFGEIVLSAQPAAKADGQARALFWRDWLLGKQIKDWPNATALLGILNRIEMARKVDIQVTHYGEEFAWPHVSAEWVLSCESVLAALENCSSIASLKQIHWQTLLVQTLPWSVQDALNKDIPTHIRVPSGAMRPLRYDSGTRVVLAVKMQEMYGSIEHISIGKGRQRVTIELLSPANRPIQTTENLPGFWLGSYVEVRKEMKGRYPKHVWPEDPTTVQASVRTTKLK